VLGEFFFATVKAIGTPLDAAVVDPLRAALDNVDYRLSELRLSERLLDLDLVSHLIPIHEPDPLTRYQRLMDAGDLLRIALDRPDALAVEVVAFLSKSLRAIATGEASETLEDSRTRSYRGIGYLFRGLMHPAEAQRLRSLYGSRLFIIAAYYPEDERTAELGLSLAHGDGQRAMRFSDEVANLIRRDRGQLSLKESRHRTFVENRKRIINVSGTFPHADVFVDARDSAAAAAQIERLVELIFGHPFHTPTTHEIAMAAAYSAAIQSANPARRVGAAVVSREGDILATGTNEVAKPGGSTYGSGERPDYRDHQPPRGYDPSDRIRRGIVRSFLEALMAEPNWLEQLDHAYPKGNRRRLAAKLAEELVRELPTEPPSSVYDSIDFEEVITACVRSEVIWNSELFDVLEYARGMHAEMDAITSAARKGVAIQDATLYCTTLPCHECARLIIGSGMTRVYFIQPYEKSRVSELYSTEIQFGASAREASGFKKVEFLPYVGISPTRFDELFSWVARKVDDERAPGERMLDGSLIDWRRRSHDGKVRRSIITNDALYSRDALEDLCQHEAAVVESYRLHYARVLQRRRRGVF
jgi:cytidine deaminase